MSDKQVIKEITYKICHTKVARHPRLIIIVVLSGCNFSKEETTVAQGSRVTKVFVSYRSKIYSLLLHLNPMRSKAKRRTSVDLPGNDFLL